jgi:hypothetical protein
MREAQRARLCVVVNLNSGCCRRLIERFWIPACAGMTTGDVPLSSPRPSCPRKRASSPLIERPFFKFDPRLDCGATEWTSLVISDGPPYQNDFALTEVFLSRIAVSFKIGSIFRYSRIVILSTEDSVVDAETTALGGK